MDGPCRTSSASSNRQIRSLNRFDLLDPLWLSLDPLPQLVHLFGMHFFLSGSLRLPLLLSKSISCRGALQAGNASERLTPLEALYKCLNTIQYNTIHGRSVSLNVK